MRTLHVAVAGVTGMVVAGCGGEAGFTPRWLADEGAAGAPVTGIPESGGAGFAEPGDAGSTFAPPQGGRPTVIGTGGAIAVTGGVGVGGRRPAVGGAIAVGGSISVGGTAALGGRGGSVSTGGTAAVGDTGGITSRVPTGGSAAVGGRAVGGRGGSRPVGGSTAVGGRPVGGRGGSGGSTSTGGSVAVGGSAASGGVLIAGTGGTDITDPLPPIDPADPPPEGCEPYSGPASDDKYCQLSLVCDDDYFQTYCNADYQGSWYCGCSSNSRYLSYSVTGAKPDEACAAVSALCASQDPLEVMGQETCVGDEPQASYCTEQCQRSRELRGGGSVVLTTSKYVSCYEQDALQRCQCDGGMLSRIFDISTADGAGSCRVALDACDTDPPSAFDGPAECETGYASSYGGYCEIQQDCWRSAPVRENVTELQYDPRYFNCYDEQPGGSTCSCSGNQWSMAFQMPGRSADADLCDDVRAVCARPEDIASSGVLECTRSAQSAGTDYCDAQITCTQPASSGELDFIMNSWVYLYCQLASSGAWTCTCSAGAQNVDFEVEDAEAWDVCTAAAERCPELVDVMSLDGGSG